MAPSSVLSRAKSTAPDKGKLLPTDVGIVVNDFLVDQFPNIVDYNFTARVEEEFDTIAEGKTLGQALSATSTSASTPR